MTFRVVWNKNKNKTEVDSQLNLISLLLCAHKMYNFQTEIHQPGLNDRKQFNWIFFFQLVFLFSGISVFIYFVLLNKFSFTSSISLFVLDWLSFNVELLVFFNFLPVLPFYTSVKRNLKNPNDVSAVWWFNNVYKYSIMEFVI